MAKYEDLTDIQRALWGISLADHMGDVNNELPDLAAALGLDAPVWDDELNRLVWSWEPVE